MLESARYDDEHVVLLDHVMFSFFGIQTGTAQN
jgi:hypothetical protein